MSSAQHVVELASAIAEDLGPQLLKEAAGATIGKADELVAALSGSAIRDVLLIRAAQIAVHGHDREYDSMLAIGELPKRARQYAAMAHENITDTVGRRDFTVGRRRLAKCAALCLAAMDRLEQAERQGGC